MGFKKILIILLLAVIAFGLLLLKPPLYFKTRSYLVMYAHSYYEKRNSLLDRLDLKIEIPAGTRTKEKDWYPFVLVYTADEGFSDFMSRQLSLTILYNFGAFDWKHGTSSYYQAKSPYYNSYYGAYIVKEHEANHRYAFTPNGDPIIEEILSIPEYDFKHLVMESLGCPTEKLTMEALSYDITSNVDYVGHSGWHRMDGLLLLNNPNHKFKGNRRAYIQFGNPIYYPDKEEFSLITMHGRIYARYFDELKSTLLLYIMTPNSSTLEECDQEILSKTIIDHRNLANKHQ